MPKLSRAIAGNSPTYGSDSSENVVRARRMRGRHRVRAHQADARSQQLRIAGLVVHDDRAVGRCTDARASDHEQIGHRVDQEELRRR